MVDGKLMYRHQYRHINTAHSEMENRVSHIYRIFILLIKYII